MPMTNTLPEDRRQLIFADLVAAQDAGAAVPDSRAIVAAKYGITIEVVRQVEREGLDKEWPPL
jgi:hypothetical protein